MKHALALLLLLLLSCVLVAQEKPTAEAPKPAPYGFEKAAESKPYGFETAAESKPKIPPINVRDELIELIHQLKKESGREPYTPSMGGSSPQGSAAMYDAELKAKTEAQRLLLQALLELAKEAAKPTAVQVHSSSYKAP
jgi:hypothetical protein